jgi:hypothetical protein
VTRRERHTWRVPFFTLRGVSDKFLSWQYRRQYVILLIAIVGLVLTLELIDILTNPTFS